MSEADVIDVVPTTDDSPLINSPVKSVEKVISPSSPQPEKGADEQPVIIASQSATDLPSKVGTQSFQLHLRNRMLDAIEELRVRRVADVQNETKTKKLVEENHLLKNTNEELKQKMKSVETEQNEKMSGMKTKLENVCKDSKSEKAKLLLSLESKEKELKNLKEEIRSMHLAKYSMEKKLEEMERKHHRHSNITDSKLVQVDQLEKMVKTLSKKFLQLCDSQERLQKCIVESGRQLDKLVYVATHKDCEIRDLKAEASDLKKEVSRCHVQLQTQKAEDRQQLQNEISKNTALSQQIEVVQRDLEHTKKQLEEHVQDKQWNMEALKQSHELLEKQISLCNKTRAKASDLEEELNAVKSQLDTLKQNYDDKAMELEIEKAVSRKDAEDWKDQKEGFEKTIKEMEEKLESLSKSLSELDALNSKWSQKNMELTEKVKELQAFIDRPKQDASVQSENIMETVYVQTECITATISTQTICAEVSAWTQTCQECEVKQCQTEEVKCSHIKIQTDPLKQNHFQVQVDLEPPIIKRDEPEVEDVLPSSLPLPSQTAREIDSDIVSSSQPTSSSDLGGSPARKPLGGGGDTLELSPYSRFQQTLKALGAKRKSEEAVEGEQGTKKKLPRSEIATSSKSSDDATCDVIPPTQAPPVGILQNQSSKKKGSSKKVTFSAQLEEKKEFIVAKIVDPMSLEDDDEISLFSDDEEKFEISTQIAQVEAILKKDRLKSKRSSP